MVLSASQAPRLCAAQNPAAGLLPIFPVSFHADFQVRSPGTNSLSQRALRARTSKQDRRGSASISLRSPAALPDQQGGDRRSAPILLAGPHTNRGQLAFLRRLKLFVLLAPHLEIGGWNNTGNVADAAGRRILTAHKRGTWLALGATIPFLRASCGYVGTTDGWQDLSDNFRMDYEFDCAERGNIALTGELDFGRGHQFTSAWHLATVFIGR